MYQFFFFRYNWEDFLVCWSISSFLHLFVHLAHPSTRLPVFTFDSMVFPLNAFFFFDILTLLAKLENMRLILHLGIVECLYTQHAARSTALSGSISSFVTVNSSFFIFSVFKFQLFIFGHLAFQSMSGSCLFFVRISKPLGVSTPRRVSRVSIHANTSP